MAEDEQLTIGEIAAELKLNPSTPRAWVTSGQLQAYKDPDDSRRWLVHRRELEQFLMNATRADVGRPRRRVVDGAASRDDWAGASDERMQELGVSRPGREAKRADRAFVSPQRAYEELQRSDNDWRGAVDAFGDFPERLRALAEAADLRSRSLMLAHLAGLVSKPREGASRLRFLAPGLSPDGGRPGAADIWAHFDETARDLTAALEVGELPALADTFSRLSAAATELADVLESGEEQEPVARTG